MIYYHMLLHWLVRTILCELDLVLLLLIQVSALGSSAAFELGPMVRNIILHIYVLVSPPHCKVDDNALAL